MRIKKCSGCGEFKQEAEFDKDRTRYDGHKCCCKVCLSIRRKKRYEEKRDEIRAYQSKYYKDNREKCASWHNESYIRNRDKAIEDVHIYSQINKGMIKQYNKKYYKANREKMISYSREYYKSHKLLAQAVES